MASYRTADGAHDGVEFVEINFDESRPDAVAGDQSFSDPSADGAGMDVECVCCDGDRREAALRFVGWHSISLCEYGGWGCLLDGLHLEVTATWAVLRRSPFSATVAWTRVIRASDLSVQTRKPRATSGNGVVGPSG